MNIVNQNGYIFHNGKLQWFEFISALVDFKGEVVQYECKLGGVETTLEFEECPTLFKTEEHYKNQQNMAHESINWEGALYRVFNATIRGSKPNETGEFRLWQVKNNRPIEVDAPKSNFLYKNGGWRMNIEYLGKGEYHNSREKALMYCDLVIVESDGTQRTEKSAASKMLLNDEQKAAVMAIHDAIENANKMGVELLWDRECDDLYAFSKNEMEKYEIDCRSFNGDDERVDYTDLLHDTGINIYSTNTCDCGVFVEWKK